MDAVTPHSTPVATWHDTTARLARKAGLSPAQGCLGFGPRDAAVLLACAEGTQEPAAALPESERFARRVRVAASVVAATLRALPPEERERTLRRLDGGVARAATLALREAPRLEGDARVLAWALLDLGAALGRPAQLSEVGALLELALRAVPEGERAHPAVERTERRARLRGVALGELFEPWRSHYARGP